VDTIDSTQDKDEQNVKDLGETSWREQRSRWEL